MIYSEIYKFTESDQPGYYDAVISIDSSLFKSIVPKVPRDWCGTLGISYEEFEEYVVKTKLKQS